VLTRRAASHQQTGDIRTSDQHDESDRCEEYDQQASSVARHFIVKGDNVQMKPFGSRWQNRREPRR
jgi:hypothetical protein